MHAVLNIHQLPWLEVKKEMTEEKGLDPAIADKISEYVLHKGRFRVQKVELQVLMYCSGGPELLDRLLQDATLTANKTAKEGLDEMGILFTFLKAYRISDKVMS